MLLAHTGCKLEPNEAYPTVQPANHTVSADDTSKATDAADATEPADVTSAPVEYDPADDFQTVFGTATGSSIWKSDEIMLFSDSSYNYIGYYDMASDTYGVLCGRPECMHDLSSNNNSECNGYALSLIQHITVVKGRLYFVAFDEYADPKSYFLYSEKVDGTDRRAELRIPGVEVLGNVQEYYLHRGFLYMRSTIQEVIGGEPLSYTRFGRINITTGDYEIIFEDRNERVAAGMRFVDSGVYMFSNSITDSGHASCRNVIMRLDAETGELKTVLDREETDYNKFMFRMWVDDDEIVYYSVVQQPGVTAVIYKVDVNGNPRPFMDFADDEVLFDYANMTSGFLWALGTQIGNEDNEIILWVRSYEGSTIYKGPVPYSSAYELGMKDFSINDIQGGSDEAYIEFKGGNNGSLSSAPDLCFMRIEFVSPTELDCHLVFRSAQ
jgi:hypothetical protein